MLGPRAVASCGRENRKEVACWVLGFEKACSGCCYWWSLADFGKGGGLPLLGLNLSSSARSCRNRKREGHQPAGLLEPGAQGMAPQVAAGYFCCLSLCHRLEEENYYW
jgi:hypothetical protein